MMRSEKRQGAKPGALLYFERQALNQLSTFNGDQLAYILAAYGIARGTMSPAKAGGTGPP